MKKFKENF